MVPLWIFVSMLGVMLALAAFPVIVCFGDIRRRRACKPTGIDTRLFDDASKRGGARISRFTEELADELVEPARLRRSSDWRDYAGPQVLPIYMGTPGEEVPPVVITDEMLEAGHKLLVSSGLTGGEYDLGSDRLLVVRIFQAMDACRNPLKTTPYSIP